MTKKIIGVALALIIALGAVFAYRATNKPQVVLTSDQTASETMSEAAKFSQMIESGKPVSCTLVKGDDKIEYVIQNKKFAMTTRVTGSEEEPTPPVGHVLSDGVYLYSWTDDTGTGTKIALPSEEEQTEAGEQAQDYDNQVPELSQKQDYDMYKNEGYTIACQEAQINDNTFTPPAGISFVDPTAMMEKLDTDGQGFDMSQLEEMAKKYQTTEE